MPLALAWRNRGLPAPRLRWQEMRSVDARASPGAMRRRRGSSFEEARFALQSRLRPRPRPVVTAVGRGEGSSNSAGRPSSSRGPLAATTPLREKKSNTSSRHSSSNSRIAARRGDDEQEVAKRGGLLSRWAQLTAREKSVVAAFVALAVIFGPRLLLLSLVSLEAAATGALLAAERALGAAFLTSFSVLAAVAVLLLAGLFVYFLILEEERLEDSSSSDEE